MPINIRTRRTSLCASCRYAVRQTPVGGSDMLYCDAKHRMKRIPEMEECSLHETIKALSFYEMTDMALYLRRENDGKIRWIPARDAEEEKSATVRPGFVRDEIF